MNWNSLPRFYKMVLSTKIIRIKKLPEYFKFFLKKVGLGYRKSQLVTTLLNVVLIMHLSACCWRVGSELNLTGRKNWLSLNNLQGVEN